jgi:hypothetical protein
MEFISRRFITQKGHCRASPETLIEIIEELSLSGVPGEHCYGYRFGMDIQI